MVAAGVAAFVAFAVLSVLDLPTPVGVDPSVLATKGQVLIEAVLATIAGGAAYLAVAAALRVHELNTMLAIVLDLVRRRGRS